MVSDALKYADDIERRPHVPREDRTEERDQAADWIDEHVIAEERWRDTTMKDMAEESGWSRQHIANTLDAYFRPANHEGPTDVLALLGDSDDDISGAYSQGFRDGVVFAVENWGLLRDLSGELE